MKKLLIIASLVLFTFSTTNIASALSGTTEKAKQRPIGVLFKVSGKVEYTKNGKKWRKVRRNKFLFIGYQIRTGANGSGMITYKESGKNIKLQPNSLIEITDDGLVAKSGQLSEVAESNDLISAVLTRFTKSQKYATVRRSAGKPAEKNEFETVRSLTISKDYPFIIWQNENPEYSYKLIIGDKTYDVPASDQKIVKVKIDPFQAEMEYDIKAFIGDKEVSSLKKVGSRGRTLNYRIKYLSNAEYTELMNDIEMMKKDYPENPYMLGTLFARKSMWLGAIEHYRAFLKEYPDETEMAIPLLEAYARLKLTSIHEQQHGKWVEAMKSGDDYELYPLPLF